MQNDLKDAIALVHGRSLNYWPALSKKIRVPGSVNLSSSGSESMNSYWDSIDNDFMEIDFGGDSSSGS